MKQVKLSLDSKSIEQAIKYLSYYKDSLRTKNEQFLNELLDVGISVAYKNTGKYTGYIRFEKQIDNYKKHCVGILVGRDSKAYIREYFSGGEEVIREVSGILMAEFGSGWLANVLWDVSGVGQGTFPGQKHAFESSWEWIDTNPEDSIYHFPNGTFLHKSRGEEPTYPMYRAEMEMFSQIYQIAMKVWSNDYGGN